MVIVGVVTGLWVLAAAVVVATAIGVTLRRRDGRFRSSHAARVDAPAPGGAGDLAMPGGSERDGTAPEPVGLDAGSAVTAPGGTAAVEDQPVEPSSGSLAAELAALGGRAGQRATLLQFSTAFCAPCRTTRAVLADVARIVPGVAHVEVDAEANLELVRQLGIRRTPTVLVLDAAAREISRASGAPPGRAAVIAALGPLTTGTEADTAGW
ncbi:thioredoxin family protein [Pseudofrankia sp. EUN1h]|uniref:thioredoxin family protein n=1 Tax=Pseudofrankia sp. EUN1h TaxID=1834515 RepID=UPI000234B739|nr:thioredoxin family protein [Pseudofrankia sp. EUN1h]